MGTLRTRYKEKPYIHKPYTTFLEIKYLLGEYRLHYKLELNTMHDCHDLFVKILKEIGLEAKHEDPCNMSNESADKARCSE